MHWLSVVNMVDVLAQHLPDRRPVAELVSETFQGSPLPLRSSRPGFQPAADDGHQAVHFGFIDIEQRQAAFGQGHQGWEQFERGDLPR